MKRFLSIVLALCLLLCGCATQPEKEKKPTVPFTDSCGRTVDIPMEIETVVPSGSYAQIMLYTVCPEKVVSLSSALSRVQKQYLDKNWQELPVTGQFYGGGSVVSYEEILKICPDIIIDIGEAKDSIAADMDELQKMTGIPVIFIEAGIDSMAEAYDALGELLDVKEQAGACADYIRDTLRDAEEKTARLTARTRTLYAQGEYGTEVLGVGSLHSEVLDYAGADNVAVLGDIASKGGNEVSIEQILLWNPEVVILSPEANYNEVFTDPVWSNLPAVQNGQVFEVPQGPYNWLDRPPSVQRILGIKWLGNLLYPDLFNYDMAEEAQKFFHLFWHYELSEEAAKALMSNSTYRSEIERTTPGGNYEH